MSPGAILAEGMFQFLLGRLETGFFKAGRLGQFLFQFLLGRLETSLVVQDSMER